MTVRAVSHLEWEGHLARCQPVCLILVTKRDLSLWDLRYLFPGQALDTQVGNVPSALVSLDERQRESSFITLVLGPSGPSLFRLSSLLTRSRCPPTLDHPAYHPNMKICLHRCPFLIQREIISKMSLQEAFSLSTTSRKSLVLFKWCLSHQRIHIQYSVWHSNHCIEVIRQSKSTDDLDKMTVVNRFLREHPSGPTWKFLGQNVGVMYGKFPVINVYIGYTGTTKSMIKVYRYLMDMFPKATISLKFDTKSGDKVTRIMEVAKVDEVEIGPLSNYEVTMAQAALDGCANTKKLRILNNSSFAWINPKSQFEMDHLYIKNGEGWIFNRHLMQHFLNCKQVILPNTSFGRFSKDYPEFMEIWMRGCKMELLRIGGRWIQKHRITDTVGVLPGAVEVRRARVWEDEEESENRVFEPGCCYMVQRADGTRAIASWTPREFLLTTNFVILEHPS